jgi:hypothetical protein
MQDIQIATLSLKVSLLSVFKKARDGVWSMPGVTFRILHRKIKVPAPARVTPHQSQQLQRSFPELPTTRGPHLLWTTTWLTRVHLEYFYRQGEVDQKLPVSLLTMFFGGRDSQEPGSSDNRYSTCKVHSTFSDTDTIVTVRTNPLMAPNPCVSQGN